MPRLEAEWTVELQTLVFSGRCKVVAKGFLIVAEFFLLPLSEDVLGSAPHGLPEPDQFGHVVFVIWIDLPALTKVVDDVIDDISE